MTADPRFTPASRRLFRLLALAGVLLTLGAPARAREAAEGSAERSPAESLVRLLPDGAESMVLVPSVPRLLEAMRETPFGEIYANPRYRTLLGPLVDLLETDTPELGVEIRAGTGAARLPGALLTAEFPRYRMGKEKMPRVVIYETPAGASAGFLEALLAGSGGPGARVKRDTPPVAGRAVVAVQTLREVRESIKVRGDARKARRNQLRELGLTEDDLGFEPVSTRRELIEELYFAGPDFVVHCTGGRPLLEAVLSRSGMEGESGGMEAEKKWQGARLALASSPHILHYRDLRPGRGSSRREMDDEDLRLGLNEIRSVVAGLELRDDRLAMEIAVYAPEPRLGAGKLLFTNSPLHEPEHEASGFLPVGGYERDPSALIPADAVGYSAFSADLARLWTDAYRMLKAGAPDIAQLLDIYFQTPGSRGDFASNFAATFGSRWLTFSRFPSERGSGPEIGYDLPEMTAMLEIKDAAALAPVLDQWVQNLAQLLNLDVETYTVSGRRYYGLKGAELLDPRLTPLGPLAYICLAERWLILSVRQEHVLAALARMQSRPIPGAASGPAGVAPLLLESGFQKLRASFPRERFFEAYAVPAAREHVMLSPIMLLLGGGLDDASHSLVALDRAPREDIWREAFGTTGMSLRAADPAVVVDLALMYRDVAE